MDEKQQAETVQKLERVFDDIAAILADQKGLPRSMVVLAMLNSARRQKAACRRALKRVH